MVRKSDKKCEFWKMKLNVKDITKKTSQGVPISQQEPKKSQ